MIKKKKYEVVCLITLHYTIQLLALCMTAKVRVTNHVTRMTDERHAASLLTPTGVLLAAKQLSRLSARTHTPFSGYRIQAEAIHVHKFL